MYLVFFMMSMNKIRKVQSIYSKFDSNGNFITSWRVKGTDKSERQFVCI